MPHTPQALLGEIAAAVERERAMVADAGALLYAMCAGNGGQRQQVATGGRWLHSAAQLLCMVVSGVCSGKAVLPTPSQLLPHLQPAAADRRSRELAGRLDLIGKVREVLALWVGSARGRQDDLACCL